MVKVGVVVNDQIFGSWAIPKSTTILIQDGVIKGHYGATYGVQENP